ncbi:MAG: sugar phosphate isomerase/epimerase, partial [Clostridiales bacterium]|nr:sugar phosphate isomerase/epimerase [Clostridiales bacterium]
NGNMLDQYDEITKIGKRLGGVHLHDNIGFTHVDFNGKRITGDLHTMPLSFDVDYDKVMRALIETGYKGTFNFEVDSPKKVIPFTQGREELMDYARAVRLAADTYLYKIGELILGKYNLYEG